jgi:hypothetical protein
MTANDRPESWVSIGSSRTSPTENMARAQVLVDRYYVVVGFEVNEPKAFVDEIQDLSVDYGHAFFYLVKNAEISGAVSFGPNGAGKIGWFNKGRTMTSKKDGQQNGRPATADYPVREPVKAFKIPISKQQATLLLQGINELRREIDVGGVEYSALMNDTCAETAKEVLDDAKIETPSASGWIRHSRILSFRFLYAANPYKWHKRFKERYAETIFLPSELGEWIPLAGEQDPIFGVPAFAKADPMFGVAL